MISGTRDTHINSKSAGRGDTTRYDVVWTLPYREFSRPRSAATTAWWLDSIHVDEIMARKRYNTIVDAVTAKNGSIVLFEIVADMSSQTFIQRALCRAGIARQPPPITETNPISVNIDKAFRELLALHSKLSSEPTQTNKRTAAMLRKRQSHATSWIFLAGFPVLAAMAAYIYERTLSAKETVTKQLPMEMANGRPVARVVIPNGRYQDGREKCEVYKMDANTLRSVFDHSEPCL